MKAIYILCVRQLKRYVRSPARIIGSLGQPILFLVALGFGFKAMFARAGGGNYIDFLAPGIISMAILFNAVFSGIEIIWDRQFGFLKETLVAPVPRIQIMIGRTLGGCTVAVIQGLLVTTISVIAGFRPSNYLAIPVALGFMLLIALVFAAVGVAIGSGLQDMQGFQLIMNFLVLPIYFLSGAMFPLADQKLPLRIATGIDPLSYGVDGLRSALLGISFYGQFTDFVVLAVLATILMFFGAWRFSKIEI